MSSTFFPSSRCIRCKVTVLRFSLKEIIQYHRLQIENLRRNFPSGFPKNVYRHFSPALSIVPLKIQIELISTGFCLEFFCVRIIFRTAKSMLYHPPMKSFRITIPCGSTRRYTVTLELTFSVLSSKALFPSFLHSL